MASRFRNLLLSHSILLLLLLLPAVISHARETGPSALPENINPDNLLWEKKLGTHQYTIPIIDNGQLFIGIDDRYLEHSTQTQSGGGILMCLEPNTGAMTWQMVIPRYEEGDIPPSHFNRWRCGVCSRPAIDGKRLYIVGPRGDILCLDRNGQTDGNDGPYLDEAAYMELSADYKLEKTDGDIIWEYNMVRNNSVVPHDVCGSSPLLIGDYLYACTSNGQDNKHRYIVNPKAPALIVLDKKTGKLVAFENEGISKRTFHCNWSSPVAAMIDDQAVVLFGGGDGILYAFQAVTATGDKPQALKKLWQYDCCPGEYRTVDGNPKTYSSHSKKTPDGPSEIIAIPTVADGRVYVPIGQSPNHGPGQGMLSCIDIATGQKVWDSSVVDRTTAQPAIDNGLLYISDYSGKLSCLNADTGKLYWQHDMEAGSWCASPVIADGKVYVSTERNVLWILKAGKEKQVVQMSRMKSVPITPFVHDGMFFLPTQKRLFALKTTP